MDEWIHTAPILMFGTPIWGGSHQIADGLFGGHATQNFLKIDAGSCQGVDAGDLVQAIPQVFFEKIVRVTVSEAP
jgi:hypothetical protein